MKRYAIISPTGLVIGVGDAVTTADARASGKPFGKVILVPDDMPIMPGEYAYRDREFIPIPRRPSDWAKWDGAAWTDPRSDSDIHAADMTALRAERDRRLAASDWTQMPTARLSDEQRAAWDAYREALFDLPSSVKNPATPAWPTPPKT